MEYYGRIISCLIGNYGFVVICSFMVKLSSYIYIYSEGKSVLLKDTLRMLDGIVKNKKNKKKRLKISCNTILKYK